jgi:hypothetical protein
MIGRICLLVVRMGIDRGPGNIGHYLIVTIRSCLFPTGFLYSDSKSLFDEAEFRVLQSTCCETLLNCWSIGVKI